MSDGRLLMMVLVQALFEGSMTVWILAWVPVILHTSQVHRCYLLFAACRTAVISRVLDNV